MYASGMEETGFTYQSSRDEYYLTPSQMLVLPRYVYSAEGKPRFDIYDPVWGNESIGDKPGDEVLLAMLENPLVQRLAAVEQLTLPRQFSTIPGTADMSRWEHIWGSVVFVRKMLEDQELPTDEYLKLQLRTFLSDVGHTAFSHLGDWLFQGIGGPEDQHDLELSQLIEISGLGDTLRGFGIEPADVIFPDVHDWIEMPSPDLCVDRVDYGAREIQRWLDLTHAVHKAISPEAFLLDSQNRLVMKDQKSAEAFSRTFAFLPTEHWAHPVHRMQLILLQEMIKRLFIVGEEEYFSGAAFRSKATHPRDMLYVTDSDVLVRGEIWDELTYVLRDTLMDIARDQRRIFSDIRQSELAQHLEEQEATGGQAKFPAPGDRLSWRSSQMGSLYSTKLKVAEVEKDDSRPYFTHNPAKEALEIYLPPLKPRRVDPLFFDEAGKVKRLSEVSQSYRRMLKEQASTMSQAYVARLYIGDDRLRKQAYDLLVQNEAEWPKVLEQPRMDETAFKQLLGEAGAAAIYRSKRQISIPARFLQWP